jgi:hypothetical protein
LRVGSAFLRVFPAEQSDAGSHAMKASSHGIALRERRRSMARFESIAFINSEIMPAGQSADALFELGLMYCAGRDVEMDFVAAHKWFNLAAMRGNTDAKQYRMEISREMSRKQVAEAQRQAREWLRVH